jgi:signal transduction histidine kinase
METFTAAAAAGDQLMRSRSSVALAIGFGILIVLIAVLAIGTIRRAKAIYREMERTQEAYLRTEGFRRDIVADMYLADILVRDYLLDPSPQNVRAHKEQLLEIRASLQDRMDNLSSHLGEGYTPGVQQLKDEVQGYWDSLDPIFEWTPQDKAQRSWGFLRHKVLPRREAVVKLAREIARLNRENLESEQHRIRDSQQTLRAFLMRMMAFALGLGILVALVTTRRVTILERQHESQSEHILQAEADLRRLSRRLVQTQETERKSLSRELHDEVGQTLTALGMELANIEDMQATNPQLFRQRLEDAKRLNAEAMQSIRSLAMGLRPSMLDDLGLEPALQWQGREFSRHTGVASSVRMEGNLDNLDDAQRTCIYRVVQEALTNCARHAQAKHVDVLLDEDSEYVRVTVRDDGVGFDTENSHQSGLGLIGMKERVQAIDGQLRVTSKRGEGTTVTVLVPVSKTEVAAS